ncbi:MAG: ABC transporter ATP-binding protein [Chloroflexi bacterium]|nr:ABC transporter ATP-binding protein [Chloroflexota bacterium]
MGGLVDALTGGAAGGHSALFWVWVYVGASVLEEAYWAVEPVLSVYLVDHSGYRIQRRVLERAAAAPLIQFEEGAFFDHLQRASAAIGERLVNLSRDVFGVCRYPISLLSLAIALAAVHPALLPLLVAGGLPSVWLNARAATAVYQAQRRHTTSDRIRSHLQRLLTSREAAAEVRLFGTVGPLLARWRRLRRERARDVLGAWRRRSALAGAGSFLAGVAYAAGLVLVTWLILQRRLSVGGYVTVAAGALWFQEMLGGLISGLRSLEEQSQFLGDLFDFWREARIEGSPQRHKDTKEVTKVRRGEENVGAAPSEPALPLPVGHGTPPRPQGPRGSGGEGKPRRGLAVEAEHLTFAYPGAAAPVLRDVSLCIAPGEKIAIVGENGAGKTTLVKVLIGFYQPDAGVVRLDGLPLVGDQAVAARRRIAAVFQDYATYQLTARENIGFGDLARRHDEAALLAAAERAGFAGFVRALPKGLDTYLGRQFGDTELSGGQWQRVALARAFFRNANLLVLDEATAALDPLAELALFERFAELVEGRSAIMISHRLGVARLADRVIVLREGRIVEEGRHADLVTRGGAYAALFEAQAQWYRSQPGTRPTAQQR